MGKFGGKLLVSDMDATLLTRDGKISEADREAIENFISEGGKFTVASGRMVPAVRAYFNQMTINAPAILHNGAKLYCYDSESVIFERFIEEDRKQAIKRVHDTHPEFGLEIYSDELVYVYNRCFETERFKTKPYKVIYSMPDEIWKRPWIKALIIGHKEQLDEFTPIYQSEYDRGYSVRSGDRYLDIVANGVSKGFGLTKLAAILGIDMENVYAVGDNMNDIDMLKAAGHSFAVANALQEVKTIADEVVPSCDDSPIAYIVNRI
ncbi:MAG: HAD family phosphatase [Oscillospiraceae bacterium]|nr:HAD family phosphatase [Oscillospiraceae bacterium]